MYSEAQAARGLTVYQEHCVGCHGENLTGGEGPPLAGSVFFAYWNVPGLTLDDFFYITQTFMPKDLPASLPEQEYVDVVAYVLQRNGFAAGEQALTADREVLQRIRLEPPRP